MPPSHFNSRTRATEVKKREQPRSLKRKRQNVHVDELQAAVDALDLDAGEPISKFEELPLSEPTKAGLKNAHYTTLTKIQSRAIPLALRGRDILGAAKTGSGKTLAFLIPLLENLYRGHYIGKHTGLGGMIITPTRELAEQIFDVLHKLGCKGHLFTAGILTGGRKFGEEDACKRANIIVGTPGRILHHLSETPGFSFAVDNLRMLVLDEADRVMDMGFKWQLDAIVEYLPKDRQTLLFSATQTKRVSDLARLSLKEPEYISVDQEATTSTPQNLQQNYIVTPLNEKLDTLFSFLTTAKKSKVLVFLSSTKQVRFVFESFRHLQPGIPLSYLHGRQKQTARLDITRKFASANTSCLFATDVVARGLDFPAVDWVVQVDCPEDVDTYIHRVGRTARYNRAGRAVLFLEPSEEAGMLARLEARKVPIEKLEVKQKRKQSIQNQLQNMCFKDPGLKYLGQKAFISYAKSIWLQKDKDVFKLQELPLDAFATSLGLPGAPKVKFTGSLDDQEGQRRLKNAPRRGMTPDDDDDDAEPVAKPAVRTKYDRMFERQNQDILTSHYTSLVAEGERPNDADGDSSEDETLGFLTVKRRIPANQAALPDGHDSEKTTMPRTVQLSGAAQPLVIDSKRREKMLKSKKKLLRFRENGKRIVFDDAGNPHELYEFEDEEGFAARGGAEEQRGDFVAREREKVAEDDFEDKAEAKRKRKEKREKRRERERADALDEGDEYDGAVGVDDDEDAGRDLMAEFVADAASGGDGEQAKPNKRPRKWFNDDDSDGDGGEGQQHKRRKKRIAMQQPQTVETLEDLEEMAMGLLE